MGSGGDQKPEVEQKRARTTAGFTPRIYPRPQPYKNSDVYRRAALRYLGGAAKCVLATKLFWPAYASAASFWTETNGWSERTFFIACISLVHSLLYWTVNGAFLLCDRRRYFERYKMDRTEAMGPSEALLAQTWRQALIGQLLVTPCVLWLLYDFYTRMGLPAVTSTPPGAPAPPPWGTPAIPGVPTRGGGAPRGSAPLGAGVWALASTVGRRRGAGRPRAPRIIARRTEHRVVVRPPHRRVAPHARLVRHEALPVDKLRGVDGRNAASRRRGGERVERGARGAEEPGAHRPQRREAAQGRRCSEAAQHRGGGQRLRAHGEFRPRLA